MISARNGFANGHKPLSLYRNLGSQAINSGGLLLLQMVSAAPLPALFIGATLDISRKTVVTTSNVNMAKSRFSLPPNYPLFWALMRPVVAELVLNAADRAENFNMSTSFIECLN